MRPQKASLGPKVISQKGAPFFLILIGEATAPALAPYLHPCRQLTHFSRSSTMNEKSDAWIKEMWIFGLMLRASFGLLT